MTNLQKNIKLLNKKKKKIKNIIFINILIKMKKEQLQILI